MALQIAWPDISLLDLEIAELHRIIVTGQAKVAGGPVLTRVRLFSHELGDTAQVRFENSRSIQVNLDP